MHLGFTHQLGQFRYGIAHGLKGPAFGGAIVAYGINNIVIDINQVLVLQRLAALVTRPRAQCLGGNGHAIVLGQYLVALLRALARQPIHQHVVAVGLIVQCCMGQQCGHTQGGVAGHHTQLAGECRLAVAFLIHSLFQLNRRFVAEGIGNNHHHAFVFIPAERARHGMLVKLMLHWHIGNAPIA